MRHRAQARKGRVARRQLSNLWMPVVILLSAFSPGPLPAFVEKVEVIPADPSTEDDVLVRITGALPDPCWSILGHSVQVEPGAITIDVSAARTWPGACIQIIVPYALDAPVGKLPQGTYAVTVADPQSSLTVELEVRGATPLRAAPGSTLGDANSDGSADIADAVFILLYLFAGGRAPDCERAADVVGEGGVDLGDAVHLLGFLFRDGPPPPVVAVGCFRAEHCLLESWPIFCVGRWTCECFECRAVCDDKGCGDGICDVEGGETPQSCPGDCEKAACRPVCGLIGTRSEGWYDSCTGRRYKWALCAQSEAECRACDTESEGWYEPSTGELIVLGDCDCQ